MSWGHRISMKFCFGALESTRISSYEPVSSQTLLLPSASTSLSQEWNYLQRVVPHCGPALLAVEKAIAESFLPKLFGCEVSPAERSMCELPIKLAGLGDVNPSTSAPLAYLLFPVLLFQLSKEVLALICGSSWKAQTQQQFSGMWTSRKARQNQCQVLAVHNSSPLWTVRHLRPFGQPCCNTKYDDTRVDWLWTLQSEGGSKRWHGHWHQAEEGCQFSQLDAPRKRAGDPGEMSDCQDCQDEFGRKRTDGVLSSRKSGEEYGLVCSFDQESTKKNLFR